MSNLWDQLALMKPQFECTVNYTTFATYRQETQLAQFLIALHPEFEHMHSFLLHQTPLPTADAALAKLLTEEHTQGSCQFFLHAGRQIYNDK